MKTIVKGFSKLSKSEKIDWIVEQYFDNAEDTKAILKTILE